MALGLTHVSELATAALLPRKRDLWTGASHLPGTLAFGHGIRIEGNHWLGFQGKKVPLLGMFGFTVVSYV